MADSAQALLLACLHQDPTRLDAARLWPADDVNWTRLLDLAGMQRVRPLVFHRFTARRLDRSVPAAVWRALESETRQTAVRTLRFHAELAALARALAVDGIPLIVLKGAYLAQETYGNPALREMVDLDVLVRREHLQAAIDVLLARGYSPLRPFEVDVDAAASHHVTRLMGHDGAVEVHWNLALSEGELSVDPGHFWRRAVPVTIAGATMRALAPEDLLLHLCLHASYLHKFEFGLRPLCDIASTIQRFGAGIDWDEIGRLARAWKWTRGVHLSLALAADLVGAAVPPEVLDALAPAGDTARVLDIARAQVCTDKRELQQIGEQFARLQAEVTGAGKARHVVRRVFLPRTEIAARHSLAADSRWIPLLYLSRFAYLTRLYGWKLAHVLSRRDAPVASIMERKNRLRSWLAGS